MIRALAAALCLTGSVAMATDNPVALPFDVGGPFSLLDQHGVERTQVDPNGNPQLLFFGYANCPGICATAMPMMADAVDALAAEGHTIQPVMITVDPGRDQVGNMDGPLLDVHDSFIGLTGTEEALAVAYDAFRVRKELAFVDPEFGEVYSHGSFIYLLDAQGEVLTLIPPILDPDHVANTILSYIATPS